MNRHTTHLESSVLSVGIDPGRGSDLLSIVHKPTGAEILFSTPWRGRADDIRSGRSAVTATGSMQTWLEQYRGGWQTLCPNAGAPRLVRGASWGFHGEASVAGWRVVDQSEDRLKLTVELVSAPLSIDREVSVHEGTLLIVDDVMNLSDAEFSFDYAHHPALGGTLMEGSCVVDTGAATFVNDFEAGLAGVEPDSRHTWPSVQRTDGTVVDLARIAADSHQSAFGWLTDFTDHWASVTATDLGLTVRLDWDGSSLPYAWLWQELNSSADWPWFGRARVMAIEPSSTPTSGPARASAIRLEPAGRVRVPISLTTSQGGTRV